MKQIALNWRLWFEIECVSSRGSASLQSRSQFDQIHLLSLHPIDALSNTSLDEQSICSLVPDFRILVQEHTRQLL